MQILAKCIVHVEHYSCVVRSSKRALAVIDTGGDFRVTEWCPRSREWCGAELSVHGTERAAIADAARRVLAE